MSDKFKLSQFVDQGQTGKDGIRVLRMDPGTDSSVTKYEYNRIKRPGDGDYSQLKAKFGPLAATDVERSQRARKDERFVMNSSVKERLSVDAEEKRAIESQVQAEVDRRCELFRIDAEKRGYTQGLEKGYAEAYQRFEKEGNQRLAGVDGMLAEFDGARNEIYRFNEKMLIDLVFRVSKMVLLKEVSTDREYVVRLARHLIERVGARDYVKIKINPEEMASLEMIREGVANALGSLKNLTVETSREVARGGCHLETELNAVDASLDTQVENAYWALMGSIGGAPQPRAAAPTESVEHRAEKSDEDSNVGSNAESGENSSDDSSYDSGDDSGSGSAAGGQSA